MSESSSINPTKSITIIGGYGALGKWFAKLFKTSGFRVMLYGRNSSKLETAARELDIDFSGDLKKSVAAADIVWISVPIPQVGALIDEVFPLLKPNTWVVDVASLKEQILGKYMENLQKSKVPIKCLSIHPMFGPGAANLNNQRIIFLEVEEHHTVFDFFWALFSKHGAHCIRADAKRHDLLMARSLSIPHFINMANLWLLADPKNPEDLESLKHFSGTTSRLQNAISTAVITENPKVYAPIQMDNPYFIERLEEFSEFLKNYIQILRSKDEGQFADVFQALQLIAKTDRDFPDAYKKFYALYKILEDG